MFSLIASDRFADHLTPPGHPERVGRAHVMQAVTALWREQGVRVVEPAPATREQLLRVHAPAYVDRIEAARGRPTVLEAETFTSPDTADVAALAAGAAIAAVDAVLERRGPEAPRGGPRSAAVPSALALVRPPGHHAEASSAMGFCVYNNVAVAAAHALVRGLERVAIVDYDVHHGNGTQWTFYRDPRVLSISVHQYPFYPGTGSAGEAGVGPGEGTTVNIPMEGGATDGDYAMVFERAVQPVLDDWAPQLVLVSAGFDAHVHDPLAHMRLTVAGLTALAATLRDAAASVGCPIAFVTEGGYHLQALGSCLDALVRLLSGRDRGDRALELDRPPLTEDAPPGPTMRGTNAVELVRAAQKRYWPKL